MHPLDLEQFKLQQTGEPPRRKTRRPPRPKAGEWFLKGPIPGEWLTRAAKLSPRAFRVGLALWYLAGVKKSGVMKPTGDTWRRFALSAEAARLGLATLEKAGLVTVQRHRGRGPVVTINDVSIDQARL